MNVLGKISLVLALLCFLLTVGFRLALTGWIPFIGWGLFFCAFFIVFSIATNLRYCLGFLKSESLHFVSKSLTVLILVLSILFVMNYIFYKQNVSFDLTQNKIHSLSELSQVLVKAMPEELVFHYFHVDNEAVRGYEPKVREFLKPYLRLNTKLKYQSHSVFKNPDLAKKFKTGNEESALFVEYKGRIERVGSLTETAVTNALLKVSKKPKKIYFVEGHDERRLQDKSTFGVLGVKEQLERLHYKIESLESLQRIPEDVAILVMIGPRKPLSEAEQNHLQNFLKMGGALFIALDPGEDHGLAPFLAPYGITFENRFLFSAQAQAGQSELLVLTHASGLEHEVAQALSEGDNPILFISSALTLDAERKDLRVSSILEHLPNSVGHSDISPDSPVVKEGRQVAAAISESMTEPFFRLAVVADSDFVTNQFYAQPSNFNFLLAIVTYLSQDEDLLKMRPPQAETTYLIMTQTNMNLYFLFLVLPYCLVFFIVALFFKLRRFF